MKCYNCPDIEAAGRIWINYMGSSREVCLCAGCLENLKRYASPVPRETTEIWVTSPHMRPNIELRAAQAAEPQPFPADAGEKIRRERKLEELREKLRAAVEIEDYESAAALRDEIYRMEKEVHVNVR